MQSAWVNAEMLKLDAIEGVAPTVLAILGTSTATLDTRRFYQALYEVRRSLRREWPELQAACLREFTTGYGPRSGGLRRPHWNLVLKGLPATDWAAAEAIAVPVWCRMVAARPSAQYVAAIEAVGGLLNYVTQHFLKESQAPPEGWRGHRFTTTRGYLWLPTPAARKAARDAVQHRRDVWRATTQLGLGAHDAELFARERAALRETTTWRLRWA